MDFLKKRWVLFVSICFNILLIILALNLQFSQWRLQEDKLSVLEKLDRAHDEIAFLKEQGFYPTLADLDDADVSDIQLGGWVPDWAYETGIASAIYKVERIATISPVYYKLTENGELENLVSERVDIRNEVHQRRSELTNEQKQLEIIPTIQSFEPEYVNTLLTSEDKVNKMVDFIFNEVQTYNYDGIDLNIEVIYLKNKEDFYSFLEKLSSKLKTDNKKLTMPVLSKWGDNKQYSYLPETREVMDYSVLANYVDELRIMAYDYTAINSPQYGPIAPINWVEDVLEYTLTKVDEGKISLGLHAYGYSWSDSTKSKATALNYAQVMNLHKEGKVNDILLSEQNNESVVKYTDKGENFTAYFASPTSIHERLKLAEKYGINKVMFWSLGNDPI